MKSIEIVIFTYTYNILLLLQLLYRIKYNASWILQFTWKISTINHDRTISNYKPGTYIGII